MTIAANAPSSNRLGGVIVRRRRKGNPKNGNAARLPPPTKRQHHVVLLAESRRCVASRIGRPTCCRGVDSERRRYGCGSGDGGGAATEHAGRSTAVAGPVTVQAVPAEIAQLLLQKS